MKENDAYFSRVSFGEICILHTIDAYFSISFFDKILSGLSLVSSKIGKFKISTNLPDKIFIFSN